jgi:hypothetical protein
MRYRKMRDSMRQASPHSIEMKELSEERGQDSPGRGVQSIVNRLTKRHGEKPDSPDTEQRQGLIAQEGDSEGSEFEEIEINFHDLPSHTRR